MTFTNSLNLTVTGLVSMTGNATYEGKALKIQETTYVGNGTFTKMEGLVALTVQMVGAGGGGGGASSTANSQTSVGGGGGAGSFWYLFLEPESVEDVCNVSAGVGGLGGAAGNNAGQPGTASTFTSLITYSAPGGSGGQSSVASALATAAGGLGGQTPLGPFEQMKGSNGFFGISLVQGNLHKALSGAGGTSIFGGDGGQVLASASAQPGISASIYGSGGGGAASSDGSVAAAGGSGAGGIVIVTAYYFENTNP